MVLSALCLLLLASTYSLARRSMSVNSKITYHQDDKVKIKKDELPESARKTLEGDAFKGWMVGNAYKLKSGEYEVELKKGENVQSIKFDKDGKVKS